MNSIVEKSPNALSDFTRRPQILQLRHREVRVRHADARRALADVDEAVGVAVDQRPQQHAADDAEDRRVGADPQRQRDDDGDGQALGSGERPKGDSKVGDPAHSARAGPVMGPRIPFQPIVEAAAGISTSFGSTAELALSY